MNSEIFDTKDMRGVYKENRRNRIKTWHSKGGSPLIRYTRCRCHKCNYNKSVCRNRNSQYINLVYKYIDDSDFASSKRKF